VFGYFSEALECFPSFLRGLERGIVRTVRKNPPFAGRIGALGRTRTCHLLIRSQDTGVYSCLWLYKNRLSKPTSHSGCSQLFSGVTVKSLLTTMASDERNAAFRYGEEKYFQKPSLQHSPFSETQNSLYPAESLGSHVLGGPEEKGAS
jgi:hypothetical protein